jgi:hypothetical protein
VQRVESHRLLLLFCPIVYFSTACTCSRTADLPHDSADAAGCSPKAAAATGNAPRHVV